eukprot:10035359-Lingulodinium_polyedra.AAC.1
MAEAFVLATAMLWCRHHGVSSPTIQPDAALAIGAAEQSLDAAALGSAAPLLAILRALPPSACIQHCKTHQGHPWN